MISVVRRALPCGVTRMCTANPPASTTGEIGAFEGVRFIRTPRAKLFENASNAKVYRKPVDVMHAHLRSSGLWRRRTASLTETARSRRRLLPSGRRPSVLPAGWLVLLGGYARIREALLRRIDRLRASAQTELTRLQSKECGGWAFPWP
jgi:hypothetical protein